MKRVLCSLLAILFACYGWSADRLSIRVHAGDYLRKDVVVSADLSGMLLENSASVALLERKGKRDVPVPCQLHWSEDGRPQLYWILEGETTARTLRTFWVEKAERGRMGKATMSVEDTREALILRKDNRTILHYNYTHVPPPAGVDPIYGRSGFIHPAYSPAGHVLTTIQPEDHYHHYGIWNAWTRVLYEGEVYDLWNLKDKQGTVRARGIEEISEGPVFAGFRADLDHCVFTPVEQKVILNERWNLKAWNIDDGFLWDLESHFHTATDLPLLLQAYRYGGFVWRATQAWTKDNCEIRTSEGKTRQQIDGSTARWIYVTGDTPTGRSGLLLLGHPANFNAPEPLRIWDENANKGRGDVFVNFAPVKNSEWLLQPKEEYVLRYRILAYDGEMSDEKAERLWLDYAHPPRIELVEGR